MDKLDELTPCHQYYNLAAIRQLLGTFSDIPQIACSDTAFHEDLAPNDRTFIWSGLPMGKRPGALNSGKEVYLIALLDSKDDNARAAVE